MKRFYWVGSPAGDPQEKGPPGIADSLAVRQKVERPRIGGCGSKPFKSSGSLEGAPNSNHLK